MRTNGNASTIPFCMHEQHEAEHMNGYPNSLPSIAVLKEQARRLRAGLAREDVTITHSKSLELLAGQFGYKDWNTLRAAADKLCPSFLTSVGTRVSGQYLGQQFEGSVVGLRAMRTSPGRFRVTVKFDQPVDVVTCASMCNVRRTVSCIVDKSGRSKEKTSNGHPHLQLEV